MGNSFKLSGTEDTPEVFFSRESNEFRLSGRSFPEDASEFYRPVADWIREYVKQPNSSSALKIALDYFNSSSVKEVFGLISLFSEIVKSGNEAKIIWSYADGDDLMEIKGMEFQSMVKEIPFEFEVH
jgi:hypothetical protein